jgi:hypothetical protein
LLSLRCARGRTGPVLSFVPRAADQSLYRARRAGGWKRARDLGRFSATATIFHFRCHHVRQNPVEEFFPDSFAIGHSQWSAYVRHVSAGLADIPSRKRALGHSHLSPSRSWPALHGTWSEARLGSWLVELCAVCGFLLAIDRAQSRPGSPNHSPGGA